ncbi:hypothetical protein HPB52_021730 [Rhipicephalus sanguineus]|uniref:Uncharacterized protein n=1 Tax=Rhipicephalus sanguineus TaxID=34632 RepID=A0A9D4QAP7_RHISA|nr:hypothetical protein HPB52_021730 [Rhipicephalus sanguineus]
MWRPCGHGFRVAGDESHERREIGSRGLIGRGTGVAADAVCEDAARRDGVAEPERAANGANCEVEKKEKKSKKKRDHDGRCSDVEATENKATVDETIVGDAAGDCQGGEEVGAQQRGPPPGPKKQDSPTPRPPEGNLPPQPGQQNRNIRLPLSPVAGLLAPENQLRFICLQAGGVPPPNGYHMADTYRQITGNRPHHHRCLL